ncbi:MAG TPA: hypothetical protein VGI10_30620 [Polyangiaceae bacterium]
MALGFVLATLPAVRARADDGAAAQTPDESPAPPASAQVNEPTTEADAAPAPAKPAPAPAKPAPPPVPDVLPPEPDSVNPKRKARATIAWIAAGTAVVGLGGGGVFGLVARSSLSDSNTFCSSHNVCTGRGIQLRDQASSEATVATISSVVGLGALVTSAVLFLTLPSKNDNQAMSSHFAVTANRGAFGLSALAHF